MGILSTIFDKLRHHASAPSAPSAGTAGSGTATQRPAQPSAQPPSQPSAPQPAPPSAPQLTLQDVDVDKVLSDLAAKKGGGGNYRQSIVDLLKLLDLDSSLDARRELAKELGVNAGAHGSPEQNTALHKAVMQKVAENGGKVPESMKH